MESIMLTSEAYDGRYLEVTCQQVPRVEENASEIRWTLSVKGGNSGWYSTGPTTVTIGGQQVYYCKRKSYSTGSFPAAKGSVSGSLTVPHGADGSCALEVTLETAIYTQTLSTVTDTWQLEPIRVASEISAADGLIGGSTTVIISRRSSAFTHSVYYRFGGVEGWLDESGAPCDSEVIHGSTVLELPLSEELYRQIPDRTESECLLTCYTWYGGQVVGRTVCSFFASVDPAQCGPVVEATVEPGDTLTAELTGGPLIPGVSTVLCRVTATARKSAELETVLVEDQPVTDGVALLPAWALPTVLVAVTDSRGITTRVRVPCNYVNYREPTNLATVARPEPTADSAVLTLRGEAFAGSFGLRDNELTATVEVDGRSLTVPLEMGEAGYLQTVELEGLSYTQSYPVTVTVTDLAMSVTRQLTVHKGLPVFDWGETDFRFHVPVELPQLTINGTPLADYIRTVLQS